MRNGTTTNFNSLGHLRLFLDLGQKELAGIRGMFLFHDRKRRTKTAEIIDAPGVENFSSLRRRSHVVNGE